MYWKPRGESIRRARTVRKINPETNRLCWHGRCAICQGEFLESDLSADHILPIVDPERTAMKTWSWDEWINRAFVEVEGYQALCPACHSQKTAMERGEVSHIRTALDIFEEAKRYLAAKNGGDNRA